MSRMVPSVLGGGGTALPPIEKSKQYLDFPCVVPLLCGELRGDAVATCMKLERRKHLCVKKKMGIFMVVDGELCMGRPEYGLQQRLE